MGNFTFIFKEPIMNVRIVWRDKDFISSFICYCFISKNGKYGNLQIQLHAILRRCQQFYSAQSDSLCKGYIMCFEATIHTAANKRLFRLEPIIFTRRAAWMQLGSCLKLQSTRGCNI